MDSLIPFTTSGSLVDSVDKKMLVILRDGRKLIGVLRSYDQFANLVLEDTVERLYHGPAYGDIHRGVYLIRGENVVLLGEVDLDKEDILPLTQVPVEHIFPVHKQETEQRKVREAAKAKILFEQHEHNPYLPSPPVQLPTMLPAISVKVEPQTPAPNTPSEVELLPVPSLLPATSIPLDEPASSVVPDIVGDPGAAASGAQKKKVIRAGHGVGAGGGGNSTYKNKPLMWIPPPTYPYNLIPGRDLFAVLDPPRPTEGMSLVFPAFEEQHVPGEHAVTKPKKKKVKKVIGDGGETGGDGSMMVDLDEGGAISVGADVDGLLGVPSKKKEKKAKTDASKWSSFVLFVKHTMLTQHKKPGYREKTEKAKLLEQEREEREREKAERAAARAEKASAIASSSKGSKANGATGTSKSGASKASKSKSVAFAANQGVRLEGARNAIHEEIEEEDMEEEIEIDTRLYCVCKQMYDDDRIMIACDNCDDWCHPACVHLPEEDLDLVDLFFCPNCSASSPGLQTTYKTACAQTGCRHPARLPLSKFCSDECGIQCVMKRVQDWCTALDPPAPLPAKRSKQKSKAVSTSPELGPLAQQALSQLEATSAVRLAKRREGLVSVVDAPPDADGQVEPANGRQAEEERVLDKYRSQLKDIKFKWARIARAGAAARARLTLLDVAMQRAEWLDHVAGGQRCGYDGRLGMDEGDWVGWVNGEDGRRAFEGHGIGDDDPDTAHDDHLTNDDQDDVIPNAANGQHIANVDVFPNHNGEAETPMINGIDHPHPLVDTGMMKIEDEEVDVLS
ncbi:SM-like, degradation of cytoplasmic mRNAs and positively regulates transcription initiation [Tulasnella sp. 403]|nr:SM-like, degradation of cytoplasmic mRNAs and positively regulates transcription initiation [Tulasnella sp. 403]